jgi:biopolymer transport protein ExbB
LIVTIIITLERGLYWYNIQTTNNTQSRETLLDNHNQIPNPRQLSSADLAICIAHKAIEKNQLAQAEIDNLLKLKQLSHYRFMRLLDVITSVAPLLGILGTIWGIISSFNLAGELADIEPAAAMLGMSEAFITTAFGLVVSLLSLFAYNYYQALSEKELVENDMFLTTLKVKLNPDE